MALAIAIRSLTLLAGEFAGTTSTLGKVKSGVTGWKSLIGSKRNRSAPAGWRTGRCWREKAYSRQAATVERDRRPHAAAAAAVVDHDAGLEVVGKRLRDKARHVSELPPGGNGTMMVIGREDKSDWATASGAAAIKPRVAQAKNDCVFHRTSPRLACQDAMASARTSMIVVRRRSRTCG